MEAPVDFATLTLCDALDLATLVEEEARARYDAFAHAMALHRDFEAAKFFRAMVDMEGYHTAALQARRQELFCDAPVTVRADVFFDVDAPPSETVRPGIGLREALEISRLAEQRAWRFFDEGVTAVGDPVARELFAELRDDEARHLQMVEDALAALPVDAADDLLGDWEKTTA